MRFEPSHMHTKPLASLALQFRVSVGKSAPQDAAILAPASPHGVEVLSNKSPQHAIGALRLFFATLLLAIAGSATAPAQSTGWTERAVGGPLPRQNHAMAHDAARGVTVMFGGSTLRNGICDEMWEWNGSTWTRLMAIGPSARVFTALAYDSARRVIVLFGGYTGTATRNGETWEWDGLSWTQRMVNGPSPRGDHAMAYDSARGVVVLFGGSTSTNAISGETWEWDGMAWTLRATSGPTPRHTHAMAYDAAHGVTVLFGGLNEGVGGAADTWIWDGSLWTRRQGTQPSARRSFAMTYDASREVIVLFGGNPSLGSAINYSDTWELSGSTWSLRATDMPSPREHLAMAYDSTRHVTVLFGGSFHNSTYHADTWEFGTSCSTTSVTTQPASQIACPIGSTEYSVIASGTGPLTYQWQIQLDPDGVWQTISDIPSPLPCGGSVSGTPANSPTIHIGVSACPSVTHYQVRCSVSGAAGCGTATSDEAAYTVCHADIDCNHSIEPTDIAAFVQAWFAAAGEGGGGSEGWPADFDGNGHIEHTDVAAFVSAWLGAVAGGGC